MAKYIAIRNGKEIKTAEDLKGTKVKVNPETSKFILGFAFSLGFKWKSLLNLSDTNWNYLFFYKYPEGKYYITYGLLDSSHNNHPHTEIQIIEKHKEEQPIRHTMSKYNLAVDKLVELGYTFVDEQWVEEVGYNDTVGFELCKELHPHTDIDSWRELPQAGRETYIKVALARPKQQ